MGLKCSLYPIFRIVTDEQKAASYHCGIDQLLKAAYQNDFNMLEMGKCKSKYPTFDDWYKTLNEKQRNRVDIHLADHYRWASRPLPPNNPRI